jgi:CHAT domain
MADDDDKISGRRRRGPFRGRRHLPSKPVEQTRSGRADEISLEDLPDRNPDELETLPKDTALLRITRQESSDGTPRFGFEARCHCTDVKFFSNDRYGRPDLAINDNIQEKGPPPGEFLQEMRIWSFEKGELTRWLYNHRYKHGQLKLVIWDDTGYRLPWELLWLSPWPGRPGPEPGFLGAVLTVTRWVRTDAPFPEIMRPPTNPDPYQARGSVAAHIAADMILDKELLTDFIVEEGVTNMEELFHKLTDQSGALAMVYVACHGTFGSDPKECRLDGFPYGRAVEFDDNLGRLRETLVFLNSCVSGLMGVDTAKYNDGALRGFAEVFLRSGAAGVLATTGAVGNDEARALARDLFDYLKADQALPVATAVRQLRAQALREMNNHPEWFRSDLSDDDRKAADLRLLPLLYPFMYIYYGSPWLLFSAARRQRSGGAGRTGATDGDS